jgi:hypothetical protein
MVKNIFSFQIWNTHPGYFTNSINLIVGAGLPAIPASAISPQSIAGKPAPTGGANRFYETSGL